MDTGDRCQTELYVMEYNSIITDTVFLEPGVRGACVYNECDLSNYRRSAIKNYSGIMAPLEHTPALPT